MTVSTVNPVRIAVLVFVTGLLLAACVEDDPRYPVYFRYAVDVKVNGHHLRIERVAKCTGTLVTGAGHAPGVTTGHTYLSPPIMGAYVPGTRQAVYTPVVSACRWASATPEQREEDAKKRNRVLDQPFTENNRYLPPSAKLPALWVSDDQSFEEMEYYVSARALSGIDSRVEFIKAHPPEIVDETAFELSEKRAESESPDLTPFFLTENPTQARETKIYQDRFSGDYSGGVFPVCYAAWRIPRVEWAQVPGLEDWVAELPNDGRAYLIADALWKAFNDTNTGIRKRPTYFPVDFPRSEEPGTPYKFEAYDQVYPVISTDDGSYINLIQQGRFGCEYLLIQPQRVVASQKQKIDRSTAPTPSYQIKFINDRLYARFVPVGAPVYVRDLDEFIVFKNIIIKGVIGEPVAKGWKEHSDVR